MTARGPIVIASIFVLSVYLFLSAGGAARAQDASMDFGASTGASIGASIGQNAPIAGSGQLPAIDPYPTAPRKVIDAIGKLLANREDNVPFRRVKSCFRQAGDDEGALFGCRQLLNRYFTTVRYKYPDKIGGLPALEVYTRLVAVSGDPDAKIFVHDVYSLRGILITVNEARRFRNIRQCFDDAGPQPVMRRMCRQQLDTFDIELMNSHPIRFRDYDPKLLRQRLYRFADRHGKLFGFGEMSLSQSLRAIQERQQAKQQQAAEVMASARGQYCPRPRDHLLDPLEDVMSSDGVCLCTYGRLYVGARLTVDGTPVQAGYRRCSDDIRFRIVDLNGGRLMPGDRVALKSSLGNYVSVHRDGYLYADRTRIGTNETFRIVRAVSAPGRIRAGEMVTLASPRGGYVISNVGGGGRLRTTRDRPDPYNYFVFTW